MSFPVLCAFVMCFLTSGTADGAVSNLCPVPLGCTTWGELPGTTLELELQETSSICNSTGVCTWDDKAQVKHVAVPEGVPIRICQNVSEAGIFTLREVPKESFVSCSMHFTENMTASVQTGNNTDRGCSEDLTLDIGSHFFIGNSTDNCLRGMRIAVTVKRNLCWQSLGNQSRLCGGHGNCVIDSSEENFSCVCCAGYTSTNCDKTYQEVINTTDDKPKSMCQSSPCSNNGTCLVIGRTSYTCLCAEGYTGANCNIIDLCTTNPCAFGICQMNNKTRQCYCIPGYHGELCEKDYNECQCKPCQNGGHCIDQHDRYECVCPRGYTGTNCSRKVNLCGHNPCKNNSVCVDLGTSIRCLCRPGYTGHNCEVNINDCSSNPCLHMGTCHDSVNGYWCACTEPHAGFNCEFTFDVFAPPMETEITEEASKSYLHNLYIVAGTLMGAICIVVAVVTTCYCRLHETYKKIRWKRLRSFEFRTPKGSLEVSSLNKPRLSTDAIMEATSLTRDMHSSSSYSDTLSTRLV